MTYTVYQHRNLRNGKSYVGMTSQEPKERWDSGWGYKNNSKMWNDIKESDWNTAWEHNILGKFEKKQEALNVEEMFIWLFDSTLVGRFLIIMQTLVEKTIQTLESITLKNLRKKCLKHRLVKRTICLVSTTQKNQKRGWQNLRVSMESFSIQKMENS